VDEIPKIELVRDVEESEPRVLESASHSRLNNWLVQLVERGGSDLLLVSGSPPSIRLKGEVTALENRSLDPDVFESIFIANAADQRRSLKPCFAPG